MPESAQRLSWVLVLNRWDLGKGGKWGNYSLVLAEQGLGKEELIYLLAGVYFLKMRCFQPSI